MVALSLVTSLALGLDNGLRVPPMGWSSWYGFTQNIDEAILMSMADGLVSSGLAKAGYTGVWLDDGWVMADRDPKTQAPVADPLQYPSGMKALGDYLHGKGLKFGLYTSKGTKTCLGYQTSQPNRTGSCGFEAIDANTYVKEWGVDAVKDDGCGSCPQHDPFATMAAALNATGKPVWYAVHGEWCGAKPDAYPAAYPAVANMWRTGDDLSASSFDMWTNRLDRATAAEQRALAGPGRFPNPDFLEVGYSPRQRKGESGVQSALEQRSMFTMWAALPAPLMLSADVRANATGAGGCGGVDAEALETLTNAEVIAVNQDDLAQPMSAVKRSGGLEVWQKALTGDRSAVVFFYRNATNAAGQRLALNKAPYSKAPNALDFDLVIDAPPAPAPLTNDPSLCLGQVDDCGCANPGTTPRLGLVDCNASDPTQQWSYDSKAKLVVNVVGKSVLNAGPTCAGDAGSSLLLYPGPHSPAESNEEWTYHRVGGPITSASDAVSAVGLAGWTDAPRNVSVTWEELGVSGTGSVKVRDLWAKADIGTFVVDATEGFSAMIKFHEARIYTVSAV